jgi:hypothetical protein
MDGTTEGPGPSSAILVLKARVYDFIANEGPIEQLQPIAGSLLAHDAIHHVISVLNLELQDRFVNKVDQVRDTRKP